MLALIASWGATAALAIHDNREIKRLQAELSAPPGLVKIAVLRVDERVNDAAIWGWVANPSTGEWSRRFWNLCPQMKFDADVQRGATIVDFWFRDDLEHGCTDISNSRFEGYSLKRQPDGEPMIEAWRGAE